MKEELKGTAKAHAATRRVKYYQNRAAEKGTKRTKADQEEGQQREHGESTVQMEEDAPTSSSSGSGDVAPTQSSSSSSSAMKTSGREGGEGLKEAIKKRKAEEHPADLERDDRKRMRTDGNKRKAGEESEEQAEKDCEVFEGIGQDGKQEGVRQNTGGRGGGGS